MKGSQTVIIGDWVRAHPAFGSGPGTVRGNTRWLAGILSSGLGHPPARQLIVLPQANEAGFLADLNDSELAEAYRESPANGWLASHDANNFGAAFSPLFERLPEDALIVGFELSPTIRRLLASGGRRYLSIHIHPLRFLADLVFGVYSNCPNLQAVLASAAVRDASVRQQVAQLSARMGRLQPAQAMLPPGCPVLFGQTVADASLIVNGRFGNWCNYQETLAKLLKNHTHLGFVRHPHASWPRDLLAWLSDDLGATVIAMEGNAYPIIMSGEPLGPVVSLSSSIGVEAEVFGHRSQFLIGDPRELFAVPELDNPSQIMVGHRFLERALWSAINDGAPPLSGEIPSEPFYLGASHVRSTLETWSFKGLTGDDPLPRCAKIIVPSDRCRPDDRDHLLASLVPEAEPSTPDSAALIAGAVYLRSLPPALKIGETWQWDGSRELLDLPGLNDLEPYEGDGAWLAGSECRISLPIHRGGEPNVRVTGQLKFSFFRGLLDRFPVLLVHADGAPVAAWVHRGRDDPYHEMPFTFTAATGRICRLSIEISHTESPQALGMGDDPRQLAVNLHQLSVTVAAADDADMTKHLPLWGFGTCPLELPAAKGRREHVGTE